MFKVWLFVILPVVAGSMAMAGFNLSRRYALKDKNVTAIYFLSAAYMTATLIFGVCYLWIWGWEAPAVLPGFWRAVIGASAVNLAIQFLNAKASTIDQGEVSLTAPLQAMTPGLITGLALLLGEYPSRVGLLGLMFMIIGSYVLLWDKMPEHWYEYFGPIKRLKLLLKLKHLSQEERNKTLVVTMALGSAVLGTVGLLFDGLYTRRGANLQGLVIGAMTFTAMLSAFYSGIYWISRKMWRTNIQASCQTIVKKRLALAASIFGICWVGHIFLIYPAYNKAFVAYVGTLKRFSIIFSILGGYLLFQEGEFKKRLLAGILIIIGTIFISFDDLPAKISSQLEGLGF